MKKGVASRKTAVEVLLKVELEQAYANLALAAAFKRQSLSERDRAFVTFIVQGVTRHTGELDGIIARLSSRPLNKLQPALKMVLRISIFQLLYMNDIPVSAVLSTAGDVARETGHEGSAKFANAILRSFVRELESQKPVEGHAQSETTEDNSAQSLALKYSLPEWLATRWLERFGVEEAKQLLAYSQSVPPLVVRCCELSVTPEGLLEVFKNKGMTVRRGQLAPSCLIIEDKGPVSGSVEKLPGYSDGLFAIQDEAAAFVSLVVAPKSTDLVIDLCAAPGGKSLHLAELMESKGRVVAVDIHESRLNLLGKERRRLGLTNIETLAADGRQWQSQEKADAVLIDAPCTGTGVINRRSDLRQKRQEPDLVALRDIQRDLLSNGAALVKPGGVLVYSTCSIEPEENEENIRWFLQSNPQFKGESLQAFLSPELTAQWTKESWWKETSKDLEAGMLQLLPSRHDSSGFFIARMKRLG